MSVTNRKMFKRNARETLNQTAGIRNLPVQKFRAGGSVTPAQNTAFKGLMNRTPGQVLGSNMRFLPPMAGDGDTLLNLTARQALEGGIGSLSTPQLAYLQGQYEKNKMTRAFGEPQPGEAPVASISRDIVGGLGQASGMLQAAVVSPFVASEPNPNIFGGELAAQTPDKQFLESIGYQFYTPQTTEEAAAKAQQMRQGPARLTGSDYPGAMLAEEEARRDVENILGPLPGADMPFDNQEPPQVPYAPDRSGPDIDVTTAEVADETAEVADETGATTPAAEPKTPSYYSSAEEGADYDEATVDMSAQINRSEGVPPLETAQEEVTVAAEAGTGSPEDIKAEFLKLLPKYEEDPSTMGLNLALMGFAIAGGESSSAVKNIADGMKATLPNFIKSAEKKKAFEREADLLAAKYTIQRTEEERKQDLAENTYIASRDFTHPVTGAKVTAGTPFRINDRTFRELEAQGVTNNLTTPGIYGKLIDETVARISADKVDINDYYEAPKEVDYGALGKVYVRFPNAKGLQAGYTAMPANGGDGWNALTQQYVNELDKIVYMDNGMASALQFVDRGGIGASGTGGRVTDMVKAVTNWPGARQAGEALGLNYDKLSAGGELAALNRTLALQLAPVLLGESGKTISDNDRKLVAQALGFRIDGDTILLSDGIGSTFQSEEEARRKIQEIRGILRKNAEAAHGIYQQAALDFGLPIQSMQERQETVGALYTIQDAPEDADYDFEVVAGQ